MPISVMFKACGLPTTDDGRLAPWQPDTLDAQQSQIQRPFKDEDFTLAGDSTVIPKLISRAAAVLRWVVAVSGCDGDRRRRCDLFRPGRKVSGERHDRQGFAIFWLRDATRSPIVCCRPAPRCRSSKKKDPGTSCLFPGSGKRTSGPPMSLRLTSKLETDTESQSVGHQSGRDIFTTWIHRRARVWVSATRPERLRPCLRRHVVARRDVRQAESMAATWGLASTCERIHMDQVEDAWRLDFNDRSVLRPRAAIHRLTASITANHFTLDAGKQFIRWGRADILSPTDRFAPRDYLNVIDTEFLPVLGARMSVQMGGETLEGVWLPRMTPSRLPLLSQRWTVVPPEAAGFALQDNGSIFPKASEQGARWSHTGRFEMGLSFFNGFNHLPSISPTIDAVHRVIDLTRTYPDLRSYGGEFSVPTRLLTLKGEAAYLTSPRSTNEEYVLYVIEAERQVGEWLFDGGYAGEVVTRARAGFSFDAERGVARSIIGRASYTVDPRRSIAVEAAVRQNAGGFYTKGEYSEAIGQHWRVTLAAVGIAGKQDDFLGQIRPEFERLRDAQIEFLKASCRFTLAPMAGRSFCRRRQVSSPVLA